MPPLDDENIAKSRWWDSIELTILQYVTLLLIGNYYSGNLNKSTIIILQFNRCLANNRYPANNRYLYFTYYLIITHLYVTYILIK